MGIAELVAGLPDQLAALALMLDSQVALAAVLMLITTSAIGLCVPGLLMPISFSAGMLMNGWVAVPVVAAGAVLGSHCLFLAARYGAGGRFGRGVANHSSGEPKGREPSGLTERMGRFTPHLEQHGFAYVAALRMVGTPHALVTLASAASTLRQDRFALATLLGFLPSIALSAGVGTAIF